MGTHAPKMDQMCCEAPVDLAVKDGNFIKYHQISNRLPHDRVAQHPEKSKIEFGGQKCVENPSEHDALSFRSIRGRESVEKTILVSLLAFLDHFHHIIPLNRNSLST